MKDSEVIKRGEEILEEIFKFLNVEVEKKLSMEVDDEDRKVLNIAIEGENLGYLIGYRGNTLNALQLIFAQILTKEVEDKVIVLIDVNGYRQRRAKYLESLAIRAAREARDSGQDVELPPLSALERRVVHLTLKEEEGVTTESEGEGKERHIIVKIDKGNK